MDKSGLKRLMQVGVMLLMLNESMRYVGRNGRKRLNLPCHCPMCGHELPPGRDGRLCRTCREKNQPTVEN